MIIVPSRPSLQALVRANNGSRVDWQFVVDEADERPLPSDVARVHADERQRRGPRFFVDLVYALTHCDLPVERAEGAWQEFLRHRDHLSARVGRDVGIAVAALDYLANVSHDLEHPVVAPEALVVSAMDAATRDDLTGLYDRGMLRVALESELLRSARYGQPVSLALIDVDSFKQINDSLGHAAGDRALATLARIVQSEIRAIDVAARLGGDEIAVVAPGIGLDDVVRMAERLRANVSREVSCPPFTISVGVTSVSTACDPSALLQAADRALYDAKRAGRDCTRSAEPFLGVPGTRTQPGRS